MVVMVGEITGKNVKELQQLGWGRMWIARGRNIYTYPNEPWGLDNGAYRDWAEGKPFDSDQFQRVIDKAIKVGVPHLAVLPDIPGEGHASLELSMSWLDRVPKHYPWYLAVQDGITPDDIDVSKIDGIFLGGTNSYKSTAQEWCEFAHDNSLPFHYGRCGTQVKITHAYHIGADSLDSALPLWTKERWRTFKECILERPPQYDMFYKL